MTNNTQNATCCLTGHRPNKLPWGGDEEDPRCLRLKAELRGILAGLYERGLRRFICGMALGADMYFAEAVLELRSLHPDVVLEAAVPCPEQAEKWNAANRERYERILSLCDIKTLISPRYTRSCMQERNRYMVEESSVVIGVYSGGSGGTLNTLRYALSLGRELVLAPVE